MKLVEKIRAKKKMIGLELYSGSPHNVEILGEVGFDFTMLDTEHTEYDTGHIAHLIRAADSFGVAPVVRVEQLNEVLIMKTLDRGAQGVIVPRITTAEQARRAASAAAFPPVGMRGMCPDVRATRYRNEVWEEYARNPFDHVAVIPLIEDIRAVENIDAIMAVDGIDSILFGPGDFAVSIGAAQEGFTDEIMGRTREALQRVCKAAAKHDVYVFAIPLELRDPTRIMNELFDDGVSGVLFGTDTMHFQLAADRIRGAFGGVVSSRG
ncbi:aldolase/citrate lyase family protein [Bosea sp. (in: a-proteobacteria)]|uniref:HpcH/HpaI aldolase family protein n=1 Tax=Bosea sp. (in: a-proteobacteria) TaxID=1871050 RepID=UPI00261BB75B|nr:aldolase/citrate lyase family protein [Bosea sp. (in: a-proteobacteria)]MCO5089847.1 aldolase/citrate lyase family protein [Bosea sp. (in: a-proteobacteria)]